MTTARINNKAFSVEIIEEYYPVEEFEYLEVKNEEFLELLKNVQKMIEIFQEAENKSKEQIDYAKELLNFVENNNGRVNSEDAENFLISIGMSQAGAVELINNAANNNGLRFVREDEEEVTEDAS